MVRPLGVILAGGLARRMGGGDKSLLSLGASSRILDQVIARLGAQVDQLVLNANGDPARVDFTAVKNMSFRPMLIRPQDHFAQSRDAEPERGDHGHQL